MTHIGIDPGGHGAMAALYDDGRPPDVARLSKLSPREVFEWLSARRTAVAALERVHAFPTDGRSSAFKFGRSFGMLEMALVAAGIPYTLVNPETWTATLNIPPRRRIGLDGGEAKEAWKRRLKTEAKRLFPNISVLSDTADALLIAEYCRLSGRVVSRR